MWYEAVHGPWCETRVWPTTCQACGTSIWFFTCLCGSKVLFDKLGYPWPIHNCDRSWGQSLTRRTDADGNLVVDVSEGVTAIRPSQFDIEFRSDSPSGQVQTRRSWDAPIVPMDPPPGASETVTGVLRELDWSVDPYTFLEIPRTPVGTAVLDPIGRQDVGRITVHAPSPAEDNLIESFTTWVPSRLLEGLRRGITLSAALEAVEVLGSDCVWFSSELTVHR